MKVDHERQKRELEEKQQSEIKQLETLFKEKEEELLSKVQNLPKKLTKSIYSHCSRDSERTNCDTIAAGDGSHNYPCNVDKNQLFESEYLNLSLDSKRPHSAKEFYPHLYSRKKDRSRRARSMDFNHGCQDTDLDFSFQEDFMDSRDITVNNEYIIESDSLSNFSSRSSTISSENRQIPSLKTLKKFQGISSEEHAKYKQAATVITAAARGFLTRRLFKTAHVQGLITTLKDAIICATQIHTASDIAESDIDLMRRLGRQIEAAWDAVYSVFFNSDTSTKLQLIAADRERLRAAVIKNTAAEPKKKRLSSATRKSLDRKKCGPLMSKSQTSNGSTNRVRICSKMTASFPSPYLPSRLK